jgi:hypothetical protein
MSQTKQTFEDRLLPMLVAANRERRRRRAWRGRAAMAAAVLTLAAATVTFGPVAASDTVKLSAKDAIADPAGAERMLREAGIDATVIVVPVSTYWKVLDETWWWLHFDGPVPLSQHDFANIYRQVGDGLSGLSEEDLDGGLGVGHMPVIELPHDLPGHLTLFAANVVPEGQPVASDYDSLNELSPLGTFWCDRLDPNDPATLGAALEAKGYDVIWILEMEPDDKTGRSEAVTEPPPGTVVTWAWLRGPQTVDIRLMNSGPTARHYQRTEGTFLPGETPAWSQPCPR